MGHIHLHVSELPITEEFYRSGLGFDVVCRYGDQALFMSTGGYHHLLGAVIFEENGIIQVQDPSGNLIQLNVRNLKWGWFLFRKGR